jgi:hypothetical protein
VTSPGTDPWRDFIPTWVDAICVNIAPCCDAATFDPVACRAYYGRLTDLLVADPNHYAYDPMAAQTCLAEIQSDLAVCQNGFGASCTYVRRGLLRDGEPCANAADCASGACGLVGDRMECGAWVRAGLGEACAESCSLDEYGAAFCYGQPSQRDIGVCFAEDGLFCGLNGVLFGPLAGSGATCEPLRGRGESCDGGGYRVCADEFCTANVCEPDSRGDVGEPCPCRDFLNCQNGSCVAGRSLGETCDFADAWCARGLSCRDGICACGGYYGSLLMPIECSYE